MFPFSTQRLKSFSVLPIFAFSTLTACASSRRGEDVPKAGLGLQSMTSHTAGGPRVYHVIEPSVPAPAKGWPVLVALHGGNGSGPQLESTSRLSEMARKHGFLLIFPSSLGKQWTDGRASAKGGQDVDFLKQMLAEVKAKWPVNSERFYVAGISNGGMMTLRLACDVPELFQAFGVISASMPQDYFSHCQAKKARPILFVVSQADPLMPYNGGEILAGRFKGVGGSVVGYPKTLEFWKKKNACGGTATRVLLPDVDPQDGSRVTLIDEMGCQAPIRTYEADKAGHAWPGMDSPRGFRARIVGIPMRDIRANDVLVDFFGLGRADDGTGAQSSPPPTAK